MIFFLHGALLLQAPQTADEWAARGRERLANGYFSESIAAWTKAVELAADRAEPLIGRARARRAAKDNTGAFDDLAKALLLAPGSAKVLVERGYTWECKANFSNAKDDYDRAIAADPADPWPLFRRGLLKRRQNKHKEAEEDLKKACEAGAEEVGDILGRAYAKMAMGHLSPNVDGPGDAEQEEGALTGAVIEWVRGSLEDLDLVLATRKDEGSLYADRASVYISLGKFKEAEGDLRTSLRLAPRQPLTHFELGRLMEYTGRPQEAADAFGKAIELEPKYGQAYFGRANARKKLKDPKGSIADLTKAIQLNGKWPSAYFNRALARSDLGDQAGAIGDFNKVIELDSGKLVMAAYINRGACKDFLKDTVGARKDWTKAAGMEAPTAWDLEYRSWAKEKLGDLKASIVDLEAALAKSAEGSAQRKGIEDNLVRLRSRK